MKVALTGGSAGIGFEVAALLKRSGHTVHVFDIIEPHSKVDRWIQTDISSLESINAAVEAADGPYNALINNAGIPPRQGLAETVLRVNFFGLRSLLSGLLAKLAPNASIVTTASLAGAQWRDNLDQIKALAALDESTLPKFIAEQKIDATRAYNLSKEALIAMAIADTEELLARGFRTNTVSPAATSTDILPDFYAAFGERVTKNVTRVGRPGHAHEVAELIVFLASEQSHWIRGQDIVIDGGMSAMHQCDKLGLSSTPHLIQPS